MVYYGNIYHQYAPNVSIYTIHGSYGYILLINRFFNLWTSPVSWYTTWFLSWQVTDSHGILCDWTGPSLDERTLEKVQQNDHMTLAVFFQCNPWSSGKGAEILSQIARTSGRLGSIMLGSGELASSHIKSQSICGFTVTWFIFLRLQPSQIAVFRQTIELKTLWL